MNRNDVRAAQAHVRRRLYAWWMLWLIVAAVMAVFELAGAILEVVL